LNDMQVPQDEDLNHQHPSEIQPVEEKDDIRLINATRSSSTDHLPPGDVRRVMSKSAQRKANAAVIKYNVSFHLAGSGRNLSLIDRGANGDVAGNDVSTLFKTSRTIDIKGVDIHQVNNIGIGTVGGVVDTQYGPVIAIMHQYALLDQGPSIHSARQMEWYKHDVNVHVPGGKQRTQTLDGYIIPLHIRDVLARLNIRPHTDEEFNTLPHVFQTSELEWDPAALDH
jgi:hypothetical protein